MFFFLFYPFSNFLLIVGLLKSFTHSTYIVSILILCYMYYKYLLQVCGLSSTLLIGLGHIEDLNFNANKYIRFFMFGSIRLWKNDSFYSQCPINSVLRFCFSQVCQNTFGSHLYTGQEVVIEFYFSPVCLLLLQFFQGHLLNNLFSPHCLLCNLCYNPSFHI